MKAAEVTIYATRAEQDEIEAEAARCETCKDRKQTPQECAHCCDNGVNRLMTTLQDRIDAKLARLARQARTAK